ncbi:RNA polymerase sigma factor [Aliirhizobium smilacinae]|uniref:RNA polymerase sigma factor n=1 Tax=Aliirhizobium smilacinae TaxID=1395944 RepID=A0A5C4XNL7_9HYPH|nr:RNA polymerase sigma factor [Rhizobium smilacinae]TNM64928.1 RNA polymerase sigma factor [Rhizobium smilacinae]
MNAEIFQKACEGDRDAFSTLIETHYDFIHAVAWRWCGTANDAEDITQDVCLRLGRAIRGFRGASTFRTWLYTLTLNAVRDHQRRTARRSRDEQRLAKDPLYAAASCERDDGGDDTLWTAVRTLPEKQRDAVLLVYAERLSHAAAADVLGCSEKTVSWHLHEARKRLKDLLNREAV